MAKKKRTGGTPRTAAAPSERPPPASEVPVQGAMQHLKTLNSILLKETVDLREQIRHLRSMVDDVSADHCIDVGIERDVCGVVVSSHIAHLASTSAGCTARLRKAEADLAAEKAASAEKTEYLVKKADASAAELSLMEKTMLAVSRKKELIERDVERVAEERDLSRSDLDEKRMELKHLEEKLLFMEQELAQKSTSMIAAETECRKLKEEERKWEKSLQNAMHEMSSLKRSLEEKNILTVKLTKENEKVKEEGKIREGLLHSAMLEIDLLKRSLEEKIDLIINLVGENEKVKEELKGLLQVKIHLTTQLASEKKELERRKEAEIKLLNAEIESNASKISSLEEKCSSLDEVRNRLTDEVSELKKNLMDAQKTSKWRNSKWLYPAAITIFVTVSLAFAARYR